MLSLARSFPLLALLSLASSRTLSPGNGNGWSEKEFKYAVFFGDSYTDEGRGPYYVMTGGKIPPGWKEPEVRDFMPRALIKRLDLQSNIGIPWADHVNTTVYPRW